jgi:hypothetical protein
MFLAVKTSRKETVFEIRLESYCRILERTISLRLLGIILRFSEFEVSVYSVYITNQF